jgi:hypothetical protein
MHLTALSHWSRLIVTGGRDASERVDAIIVTRTGCIRMTNEDVIDLYSRVEIGTRVVVLGPNQGFSRAASADSSYQ